MVPTTIKQNLDLTPTLEFPLDIVKQPKSVTSFSLKSALKNNLAPNHDTKTSARPSIDFDFNDDDER
jgi:hypothetical protein